MSAHKQAQKIRTALGEMNDTELNVFKDEIIDILNARHRSTTMMPELSTEEGSDLEQGRIVREPFHRGEEVSPELIAVRKQILTSGGQPSAQIGRAPVDTHQPDEKWEFNEGVTKVFEDMLERSIPDYQQMRHLVSELVANHIVRDSDSILDIGCSNGIGMAHVLDRIQEGGPYYQQFIGLEISEPMRTAARERFAKEPNVGIQNVDLRMGLSHGDKPVGIVLSILTLMFVPIEYRQAVLQRIYDRLRPGGMFIIVEKILGNTDQIDTAMTDIYHDNKKRMGYSEEDITRKALSLEGVLVPVTAEFNETLLRRTGFQKVDCFWRWMKFAGWVAIK